MYKYALHTDDKENKTSKRRHLFVLGHLYRKAVTMEVGIARKIREIHHSEKKVRVLNHNRCENGGNSELPYANPISMFKQQSLDILLLLPCFYITIHPEKIYNIYFSFKT